MKIFNYHTVPKNTRKGFLSRNSKTAFFLNWKNQKKTHFPLENFFSKNVFGKKSRMMPKNSKIDPLETFIKMKRFLHTESSNKNSRYPSIEFKNFPTQVA